MTELLTAAEIGAIFRRSEKTIRRWKLAGTISAEIDFGKTLLFDADKVRKQLTRASRKPVKPNGAVMIPTI